MRRLLAGLALAFALGAQAGEAGHTTRELEMRAEPRADAAVVAKQFGVPLPMARAAARRYPETKTNLTRNLFFGEFDHGSGRTLAACLKHASRTR